MKLTMYLLRKFIGVFLGALFLFTYAMVMLDTINNISSYITNKAPMHDILTICAMLTPKSMCMFAPLAVLFAAAYVLSDMYAKNELVSVLAGGISLYKFTAPLVLLGVSLAIGFFFFEDRVAVDTYRRATDLQKLYVNKKKNAAKVKRDQIVIISQNSRVVYDAIDFDEESMTLFSLIVVFRDDQRELKAITQSDEATWDEESSIWHLVNPVVYIAQSGELNIVETLPDEYQVLLNELPSTFKNNVTDIETVDVSTAKEHIDYLKRAGLPYTKEQVDYYKKFSAPCAIFITILMAIGLSGKTKQNVLIVTLASCIGATAVYYIMQMVMTLLSQFGYLNPALGAWLPVALIILVSLEFLRHVRT